MNKYKSEIRVLILNVLKEMVTIRAEEYDNEWRDANDPGIIISCEALLSFLTPANAIPELRDDIVEIIGNSTILTTLDNILDWTKEGFYGSPYVSFLSCTKEKKELEFIDSACFVVSTLYLAQKVLGKDLNGQRMSKIRNTFDRGLALINESFIEGKGWSWGTFDKPSEPFIYSTWTAIESLSDLLEDPTPLEAISAEWENINTYLKEEVDTARRYIEDKYIERTEEGTDITKGTVSFTRKDSWLHYNLWIVISLLLSSSRKTKEISRAIDVILSEFDDERRSYLKQSMQFFFDGKEVVENVPFTDRSFLPLLLKCLSLFTQESTALFEKYEKWIATIYKYLLENRDPARRDYVWDMYAEGNTAYGIYYTERAIEALIRLYKCIEKIDIGEAKFQEMTVKMPVAEIAETLLRTPEFIKKLAQVIPKRPKGEKETVEDIRWIKTNLTSIKQRLKKIESLSLIKDIHEDAEAFRKAKEEGKQR